MLLIAEKISAPTPIAPKLHVFDYALSVQKSLPRRTIEDGHSQYLEHDESLEQELSPNYLRLVDMGLVK